MAAQRGIMLPEPWIMRDLIVGCATEFVPARLTIYREMLIRSEDLVYQLGQLANQAKAMG
jgi:hypothetical protein